MKAPGREITRKIEQTVENANSKKARANVISQGVSVHLFLNFMHFITF